METSVSSPDVARVDHALHGYSDGHRLLSASLQIPRNTQRVMLAMSDRSGPGRQEGFDSYVTGYPLPEIQSYAVARTWHAVEMPRPGCVWTHTLIVPMQTLARLSTLLVFDSLFRRPEGPEFDREVYTVPGSLESVRVPQKHTGTEDWVRTAENVLRALYGQQPNFPVFILGNDAEQWHRLILDVWTQQWGGLRSRFSFCTGSVNPRSVADRPLDLQVVPRSRRKEVMRGGDHATIDPAAYSEGYAVERREREGVERPGGAWLDLALSDLDQSEPASSFRRQLRHYAADVAPERASFAPIASFLATGFHLKPDVLGDAATFLSRAYPEASVGLRLKTALLGGAASIDDRSIDDRPDVSTASADEFDRLHVLLTIPSWEAFDAEALRIRERVRAAVKTRKGRRELATRLLGHERNAWGERAFGALISRMSATEIGDVFAWDEDLLADVLRRNPRFVGEQAVWEAPSSVQRFVLRTVEAMVVPDDDLWPALVTAALDAESDLVAAPVRDVLGRRAVQYALDWLATSSRYRLPPEWVRVVLNEPDLLYQWIAARKGLPILSTCALVGELSPTDRRVLSLDPAPLVVVAKRARAEIQKLGLETGSERAEPYATALAVLLAIGLRSPLGESLVRITFAPVHALAKKNQLGWERWRTLSSLGRAPEWAVWDRPSSAEQLERAAVTAYVRGGWSPSHFLAAMSDERALSRALSYAKKESKAGREFADAAWAVWEAT